MGIKAAVEAYRESAYQNAEYDIERRIGAASLPVFGGMIATLKKIGNAVWRPFKVGGALLFGFESDADSVVKTEIPADLKATKLGEDLAKLREYKHQAADQRADGVGQMLNLEIGAGFRKFSSAQHVDAQSEHVLFPEEAAARLKAEIKSEIRRENSSRHYRPTIKELLDREEAGTLAKTLGKGTDYMREHHPEAADAVTRISSFAQKISDERNKSSEKDGRSL